MDGFSGVPYNPRPPVKTSVTGAWPSVAVPTRIRFVRVKHMHTAQLYEICAVNSAWGKLATIRAKALTTVVPLCICRGGGKGNSQVTNCEQRSNKWQVDVVLSMVARISWKCMSKTQMTPKNRGPVGLLLVNNTLVCFGLFSRGPISLSQFWNETSFLLNTNATGSIENLPFSEKVPV